MTPKEMEAKISMDGWQLVKIDGSHHPIQAPTKERQSHHPVSHKAKRFG